MVLNLGLGRCSICINIYLSFLNEKDRKEEGEAMIGSSVDNHE